MHPAAIHFTYPAFLILMSSALLWMIPRKRDFLSHCEYLVGRLPPRQLANLTCFLDSSHQPGEDRAFWAASHGVRGLWQRFSNMITFLRIVQAHFRTGRIDRTDARYIWKRVAMQTWFTLLAHPEAVICHFLPDAPHIASRVALNFYSDIALRCETLCATEGAPLCILRLRNLL